jgi:hypothetical protein
METMYYVMIRWEVDVLEMICIMKVRDLFLDEDGGTTLVRLNWKWEGNGIAMVVALSFQGGSHPYMLM